MFRRFLSWSGATSADKIWCSAGEKQPRSWRKVKEKLQLYQRREPEKSELYRIVNHGRERLLQVWEERFQQLYGMLRKEVLETFDAYLNCGLLCWRSIQERFSEAPGEPGSVLSLQTAGEALNHDPHLHGMPKVQKRTENHRIPAGH